MTEIKLKQLLYKSISIISYEYKNEKCLISLVIREIQIEPQWEIIKSNYNKKSSRNCYEEHE